MNKLKKNICFVSFSVTLICYLIIFVVIGVKPFGDKTILIGDSLEQVECVNGGKESDTSCSEHPQSPRNTPSGIVRFISWIKGHRCRK